MAEKSKGLVTADLASAVQISDTQKSKKGSPFSHFPCVSKGWRTAKPGSEHVIDAHDLALPG